MLAIREFLKKHICHSKHYEEDTMFKISDPLTNQGTQKTQNAIIAMKYDFPFFLQVVYDNHFKQQFLNRCYLFKDPLERHYYSCIFCLIEVVINFTAVHH